MVDQIEDIKLRDKPKRWDEPFAGKALSDTDVDGLLKMAPFSEMDPELFRGTSLRGIIANDTRIVRHKMGDVVVREGDYGNSAFIVLSGAVRAILEPVAPQTIGRRQRRRRGWLGTALQMLRKPRIREARDTSRYPQAILAAGGAVSRSRGAPGELLVQDVANALVADPEVFGRYRSEQMRQGALFGELAALGRVPRTVTILADATGTELLEIRWQGLRDMRKFAPSFRDHVDSLYRRFGLRSQLRQTPLLEHLSPEEIQQVADAAEFESFGSFDWYVTYRELRKQAAGRLEAEPLIAEQGQYPNGIVLIRNGFARLTRRHGQGEQTVSYLTKGQTYGLEELVHSHTTGQVQPLQYSLRAVGYADVIRIPTATVDKLVLPRATPEQLHAVAYRLVTVPLSMPTQDQAMTLSPPPPASGRIHADVLEAMVERRVINGTATMMIDLNRCVGCDQCVKACADGHGNNPRFVRHGPVIGHHMIANACMHCADPVCMIGCPTGAIHRDEATGNVIINDRTCIGCGTCAANCPYDNIRMVGIRDRATKRPVVSATGEPIRKATKCDLCSDQMGGPACQRACPHDALRRVNMQDIPALAEWLNR